MLNQEEESHNDRAIRLLYSNPKNKKKDKSGKQSEDDIQNIIIKWLKKEYPKIHFRIDWFAGHYCPSYVKEQYSNAQSGSGFPDLEILHATGQYTGLHIELKRGANKALLQDMVTLAMIPQIHLQYNYILYLRQQGKCALFGLGESHIKSVIKRYMNNELITDQLNCIVRPLKLKIDNSDDDFLCRFGL